MYHSYSCRCSLIDFVHCRTLPYQAQLPSKGCIGRAREVKVRLYYRGCSAAMHKAHSCLHVEATPTCVQSPSHAIEARIIICDMLNI